MGPGLDPNSRLLPYRFGMLIDPRGHTNSAVLETRRRLKVERLPEAELTKSGPLPEDSALIACDHVRDSILTQVPPERWPNARPIARPSHYPRAPSDAPAGVPISASLVVLPDGSLVLSSFKVTGTTNVEYKETALEFLSKQQWTPATVSGCAVVSHAGFVVTFLGITRRKWP